MEKHDIDRKALAVEVLDKLKLRYPQAGTQLEFSGAWQVLVATVLAAQCTDARVNKVTPEFFRRWPGPAELAQARQEDVEEVIRSVGCFHNKAKNLIAAAKLVNEKYGGQPPAEMDGLTSLPGVARKTANIVLFCGYGQNAGIAVDTHVKRVSNRLGLTSSDDPRRIEKDLVEVFPRQEWGDLNHRMVWFGREVCRARNPQCGNCELARICRDGKDSSGSSSRKRGRQHEP